MCGSPIFQGSRPLIRKPPPSACRPARDPNARFGDVSLSALLDSGPALPPEPSSPTTSPGTHTHSHWYNGKDHVTGAGACSLNPPDRLTQAGTWSRGPVSAHTACHKQQEAPCFPERRCQLPLGQAAALTNLPVSAPPQPATPEQKPTNRRGLSFPLFLLQRVKRPVSSQDKIARIRRTLLRERTKTDPKHFSRHQTSGKEGW